MKVIAIFILVLLLAVLVRAETEALDATVNVGEFAHAFGLPESTSIAELQAHLESKFIGASGDDMRVYLNVIIHARGSLGATKDSKQSFLAISSTGRSLLVHATYGDSGKVIGVKCSIRGKTKRLNK